MNREEALKIARKKARDKFDTEEEYIAWRKEQSAKGGRAKVPKGFSADRNKAASAGRLSGHVRRMNRRHQNR